ncbi:Translation initiation factor IF3-2, chloroplastic [Orobanche gracilis]
MAGLTSTFHQPGRPQLFKPIKPFFSISKVLRCASTVRTQYVTSLFPQLRPPSPPDTAVVGPEVVFRHPSPARKMNLSTFLLLNRSAKVRLIDEQQKMVGIVSKSQAIQMAEDAELELVILSPDADPPVVKIMDYDYNIDVHDYSVRLKTAQKFLKDGDKVKVIVKLKGRENEFRNIAIELLRRFQNDVGELAVEEAKSFRDRNMFVVLVPNKALVQKSQEHLKRKDDSEVPGSVN